MPQTWTNSHIVSNLLRAGVSWSGDTITYGFPTSAPGWSAGGEGKGFSTAASAQREATRTAIGLWDDLIAPDFKETTSSPNITVQNTTTSIGYAHAYFPEGGAPSGSVWFNPKYNSTTGTNDLVTPKIGQWGFLTYVHEFGHALGLQHPGNYNGGNPTYLNDALYAQDTLMYTVMSYFDASNTGADWVASDGKKYYAQTPMLHDILSIQALYGADTETRAGSTHYGFNADTGGSIFDFTKNAHPILTIWDGAGKDTLDLSGFSTASRINLNPGTFSDCDGMTNNLAIAFNCDIENAVGGSAADTITGNALGNRLRGEGANDTIGGGGGTDKLFGDAGSDTLTGGEGSDVFCFTGLGDAPVSGTGDVVTDFVSGSDRVKLVGIDAISGGGDDAFHLVADFTGEAGELRFDIQAAKTVVEGDVNGDGAADFRVTFTGAIDFAAGDFIL